MAPSLRHSTKSRLDNSQKPNTSVNPLKKRRRDLIRLLQHSEKLPADVKQGYQRELAACENDLEEAQQSVRRQQMIGKYHMVRFFERRRATRMLKQAEKELSKTGDPQTRAELRVEVHNRQVDLNYALYFPLDQPYSSIYTKETSEHRDEASHKVNRDHTMWRNVERAMENGTLQGLRDGKQKYGMEKGKRKSSDRRRQTDAAKESHKLSREDDDEDDGKGFFE